MLRARALRVFFLSGNSCCRHLELWCRFGTAPSLHFAGDLDLRASGHLLGILLGILNFLHFFFHVKQYPRFRLCFCVCLKTFLYSFFSFSNKNSHLKQLPLRRKLTFFTIRYHTLLCRTLFANGKKIVC